ncbi:2-amino-4-hydroxy-6-hydroxymethyldihydropteridine diphosphokinase [Rudaeicoccus suwonensis]|uniref:Bifunctional folate synthesis protein n=1 Tax=Rudaeicoccus suwonensis TaxID=657409 RepID=A0A561E2W3_9MICO|nr:2-amino-4-hydroxy-6-hydroxymethyldihydropteridine diphosphokinase [Rudaeicoccus suwonensis]TWE09949.1 dihydroneopterin aldolase/2-amino-4-hydroxy-6-hydroxymethyldihydropteridine diphosphokinase [Rudaeicoccus suwonensis]
MTDRIALTQVAVTTCHGVLKHEKVTPQRFFVDITIECDLSRAGESDQLDRTISYADVAQDAVRIMTQPPVDLIETLAEQMAAAVLARPAAEAVEVTVHKPDAPAGVDFATGGLTGPSVSVRREQDRQVVIALGANLGDRLATLQSAVRSLERTPGLELVAVSGLFETTPVGGPPQPDYYNAVAVGRSRLAPWTLLERLHAIEAGRGRTREIRWGARTLDLDLIQVGDPAADTDLVLDTDELQLPHPRAAQRAFVLVPWLGADPLAVVRTTDGAEKVATLVAEMDCSDIQVGPAWSPL